MKKILEEFKNFNPLVLKTMKLGIRFSFIFCMFATLILAIYNNVHILKVFNIGISLFESGLFFLVAFIAYGFVFNSMCKITNPK